MRKLYLSLFAVLACLLTYAATTTAVKTGNWEDATTWNNGVPGSNGIAIIPSTFTVTFNTSASYSNLDVTIRSGGKLVILATFTETGNNWKITVDDGGTLQTSSTGKIVYGTNTVVPVNALVVGPTQATNNTPSLTYTLPVKFSGFSVARQNSDVLVQWSTAEEVAALSYEVERSTDGSNWNKIATVDAKGNTSSLTNYSYSDKNVTAAVAYYRIKQVDIDGKFLYTTIQAVKSAAGAADVKVAAINNRVVLQFSNPVKGDVEVRLVTLSGQVVSKQVLRQPVGQVVLNTGAAKGNYIISISNAQDINVAKQVVL